LHSPVAKTVFKTLFMPVLVLAGTLLGRAPLEPKPQRFPMDHGDDFQGD
jgi:hypothetical protein